MSDPLDLAALRALHEKCEAFRFTKVVPLDGEYDELHAMRRELVSHIPALLAALDRRSQPDEATIERMDRAYSDSINAALDSADGTQTMKEIRMAAARAAFAALHEREGK